MREGRARATVCPQAMQCPPPPRKNPATKYTRTPRARIVIPTSMRIGEAPDPPVPSIARGSITVSEKKEACPLAGASGGWGRRVSVSDEPVLVESDGLRLPRGLHRGGRGRHMDGDGGGLLFDLPRDGLDLLRHGRQERLRAVGQHALDHGL